MKTLKSAITKKILALKKERSRIQRELAMSSALEQPGLKSLEDYTRGELRAYQQCLELMEGGENEAD